MSEAMATYELNITRLIDAPRELVWKAWTDPAMAMQWMGPRGFTTTEFVSSTEVGGKWHLTMEGKRPGSDALVRMAQGGTTLEMRPPELLRYTFAWDDRSCVGLGETPIRENIVTVRFEARGAKTIMHFNQGPFATEGERDGHYGGWNSAFDCFADFMNAVQPAKENSLTELHLRRFFAAPRPMVFAAWTKPEMLAAWWGPKQFTSSVAAWDAVTGGAIDLTMHGMGMHHRMTGKFVEVYPPYRLHFTAAALDNDGKPMFENWNSVFLEEVDGGTMVTIDVHVMTMTDVAPMYLKGMEMGWSSSLDKLAELLQTH